MDFKEWLLEASQKAGQSQTLEEFLSCSSEAPIIFGAEKSPNFLRAPDILLVLSFICLGQAARAGNTPRDSGGRRTSP